MKVLLVFAHPQRDSFCGAALDRVVAGVEEVGGECRVRDLYQEGFDPRLTASEFERERKHGTDATVSSAVRSEQEHLRWADAVVFVCPLWWSDVPAILKGWFDRVWTQGFAWTYEGESELRRLAPDKAVLLISTGNTSAKLEADGVVQALKTVTLGDRLRGVGFADVELVMLDGLAQADEAAIEGLLERAGTVGLSVVRDGG